MSNGPDILQALGYLASVVLPLFNIPLVVRLCRRKSSADLSLVWVFGVLACLMMILPVAWASTDPVFRLFSILNFLFFSPVAGLALYYRRYYHP